MNENHSIGQVAVNNKNGSVLFAHGRYIIVMQPEQLHLLF